MMIIDIDKRQFCTSYFPFFRSNRNADFDEWNIRLVDETTSDMSILVFDTKNPMPELYKHAEWLIKEYMLEEDDMLTPKAIEFKKQLMEIFHERH